LKSSELEKFRDALYTCSAASCGFCREDCPIFSGVRKESTYARGISAIMSAFLDGSIKPDEKLAKTLSLCTTCRWCTERCPINVEYPTRPPNLRIDIPKMIEYFRADLVEKGFVPAKVKEVLLNIKRTYNPWGFSPEKRVVWNKGLTIETLSDKTSVEEAFFVCCAYSYDERVNEVANVASTFFENIGIPFLTLGNNQWCCGDMTLRLGEKGLFELIAEHNIQTIEKYNIRSLISLSPHCYNTLKNDEIYHKSSFNNLHYIQVLAEKVEEGKLEPSKRIEKSVTFHDPCYLGRYNNIYEQPRKILEAIPGLRLIEMYRNKKHSFCCGGGSGRVLTEELPYNERPSVERVREAIEVGADIIATACPLCLIMLTDAIKSLELEEKIIVKDVLELISEAL